MGNLNLDALFEHPINDLIFLVLGIRFNFFGEYFMNHRDRKYVKNNFYFGFESKFVDENKNIENNLRKFLADFKKGFYESQHLKTDKNFQIKIFSTNEDLKGISFESFNINESNYYNYIDISQTYIENSPEVISISFKFKDLNEINEGIDFLNRFLIILKYSFEQLNISHYIRRDEDKITLDFIYNDSSYFQILSLINLNILFKTDVQLSDLFNDSPKVFFQKLFKFDIQISGNTHSANYFLTSFIENFNNIYGSVQEIKLKKKIENFFKTLSYLKSFIQFSLSLEFNPEEYVNNHEEESKKNFILVNNIIRYYLTIYTNSIKEMDRCKLFKSFDYENIAITIFFPKEKKGFVNKINLLGLNKYFDDNL